MDHREAKNVRRLFLFAKLINASTTSDALREAAVRLGHIVVAHLRPETVDALRQQCRATRRKTAEANDPPSAPKSPAAQLALSMPASERKRLEGLRYDETGPSQRAAMRREGIPIPPSHNWADHAARHNSKSYGEATPAQQRKYLDQHDRFSNVMVDRGDSSAAVRDQMHAMHTNPGSVTGMLTGQVQTALGTSIRDVSSVLMLPHHTVNEVVHNNSLSSSPKTNWVDLPRTWGEQWGDDWKEQGRDSIVQSTPGARTDTHYSGRAVASGNAVADATGLGTSVTLGAGVGAKFGPAFRQGLSAKGPALQFADGVYDGLSFGATKWPTAIPDAVRGVSEVVRHPIQSVRQAGANTKAYAQQAIKSVANNPLEAVGGAVGGAINRSGNDFFGSLIEKGTTATVGTGMATGINYLTHPHSAGTIVERSPLDSSLIKPNVPQPARTAWDTVMPLRRGRKALTEPE